jgi:hypothetical protein
MNTEYYNYKNEVDERFPGLRNLINAMDDMIYMCLHGNDDFLNFLEKHPSLQEQLQHQEEDTLLGPGSSVLKDLSDLCEYASEVEAMLEASDEDQGEE